MGGDAMGESNIRDLTEEVLPAECFVFKHSTRCPRSARAAARVRATVWPLPLYWVNVVEQRPLSDWVAEFTGVRHASPQLLRLSGGAATAVWNHGAILEAPGFEAGPD